MTDLLKALASKKSIVKVEKDKGVYILADVDTDPKLYRFNLNEGKSKITKITNENLIKILIAELD